MRSTASVEILARRALRAKVATEKAQALLRSMEGNGLSKDQAELNAIENIVLAETKDHADWELIGKIARQATDDRLREILGAAASEVEQEEDEHLNWTRKKLGELQMEALSKGAKSETKSDSPKAKSPSEKKLDQTNRRPRENANQSSFKRKKPVERLDRPQVTKDDKSRSCR